MSASLVGSEMCIRDRAIPIVAFTDDLALVAEGTGQAQKMANEFSRALSQGGLALRPTKCKVVTR
eukprot:9098649-Alexandrium_andersonii.AAC.1